MEIPEALAPELLVLGHVVLRGLVAVTSVVRALRAPRLPRLWKDVKDARARLRAQLDPPITIPTDFAGRNVWGPIAHA